MAESIDSIEPKKEKKPDELATIVADFFTSINYKLFIFVFLLFVLISSDIFIDKILGKFNNAVDHRVATSKGVFIQGLFCAVFVILIDALVRNELI